MIMARQRLTREEEQVRAEILAAWEGEPYPGDDRIDGCGCGRDDCVTWI